MPDLDQIAATARQHIDTRGGSAAVGFSTEARHAIDRLTERLAEQLGRPLANWARYPLDRHPSAPQRVHRDRTDGTRPRRRNATRPSNELRSATIRSVRARGWRSARSNRRDLAGNRWGLVGLRHEKVIGIFSAR